MSDETPERDLAEEALLKLRGMPLSDAAQAVIANHFDLKGWKPIVTEDGDVAYVTDDGGTTVQVDDVIRPELVIFFDGEPRTDLKAPVAVVMKVIDAWRERREEGSQPTPEELSAHAEKLKKEGRNPTDWSSSVFNPRWGGYVLTSGGT